MGRTPKFTSKAKTSLLARGPPILPGAIVTDAEANAFKRLRGVLRRGRQIEAFISNPRRGRDVSAREAEDRRTLCRIRRASVRTARKCTIVRNRMASTPSTSSTSSTPSTDECLAPLTSSSITEFTTAYPLQGYRNLERYIPRIVNVVSVAIARPIPGTGTTLPLTNEAFRMIATRCTGSYYAPRRFSNIQLGFRQPRARVLVFQTGQLVTTGTTGIASTRLVVNLAIGQLAREAGIHLRIESFAVKNIVASCSLAATFNCEGFSKENSAETNYDRSSFAGMVSL